MKNNNIFSLLDKDFLINLQSQQHREVYARIISLTIDEQPIEEITGKITSGSVNIDGQSAIRRTCSLTFVTHEVNISNFNWGLHTKFKLEIGLHNYINTEYPDIIWFPMGMYVSTSFSSALSTNGYTISISGKDKMCLLNGEIGGQLFASIDFGTEELKEAKYVQVNLNIEDFEDDKYYCKYIEDPNERYELIESLDKLFEQVENIEQVGWEANKYYYKDDTIYVLDSNTSQTSGRTYYQMKEVYTLEYQYTIKKIPLEKIIIEALHSHAKEPYENIIIQDLEPYGLEQLSYRGDKPLYLFRVKDTEHFQGGTFDSNKKVFFNNGEKKISELGQDFNFDSLMPLSSDSPSVIKMSNESDDTKEYTLVKINTGDDVGYRLIDLVYNGDLITSIGDSLVSMLDKIKTMLGDFEYFYDLNGRFVFRRKPNFITSAQTFITQSDEEYWVNYGNSQKSYTFNFTDNILTTAFNNTPNLANVRNDFIVWGKRPGINGEDLPIHARYAIDKKPIAYRTLQKKLYYDPDLTTEAQIKDIYGVVDDEMLYPFDWREIIYQMALDYFAVGNQHSREDVKLLDESGNAFDPDHFLALIAENNSYLYPTGYTGYEQYYTDMQGYWRQLYNPDYKPKLVYEPGHYEESIEQTENGYWTKKKAWKDKELKDVVFDFYLDNSMGHGDYYELDEENHYVLNESGNYVKSKFGFVPDENDFMNTSIGKYFNISLEERSYWNVNIWENPGILNFWIDFFDDESELSQFTIPLIGDRTKVVHNDKVNSIFYKEVPDIIFYSRDNSENNIMDTRQLLLQESGYTILQLPKGMSPFFAISYRSLSAKDAIDTLLYENAYTAESVSITAVPIYNLDSNSRIRISDPETGIEGEYIISRLSFNLGYNGMMSINATKAPVRIY